MPMKHPVHPGRIVKSACLQPLDLTISEGAKVLGVARPTLSNLVNGNANMSPEMAIRLEKAFGSTADTWLRMQSAYDLALARKKTARLKIRRVRRPASLAATGTDG